MLLSIKNTAVKAGPIRKFDWLALLNFSHGVKRPQRLN